MKEYLFEKKMNESLINIEDYKSLHPDKREKYDIYIPMVKDDDDVEEDEDFITTKKKIIIKI